MGFDADVVVVGAGPVGCAVALALAARGVTARVIDRDPPGRDKVCGEGLLPPGVDAARRLGLAPEGPEFRGIRYTAGSASVEADFPGGRVGLGLRRSRSDAAFVAAAARVVPVDHGRRLIGWVGGGGDLTLRTSAGALRTRLLVGADGARSTVRRDAGLAAPARGRRRWAVRRHHEWRGPLPARVEVELLPWGELYLTPVGPGEVNVALLLEDAVVGSLRGDPDAGFDALVRGSRAAAALGAQRSEARVTGPLRQAARDVVADGVVLAGDAAGFVDGITGEGMSLGLAGAEPLAEVAAAALRTGRLGAADLAPWSRRRAALVRRSRLVTELVLAGVQHRRAAPLVVRWLARHPDTFAAALAFELGEGGLFAVVAAACGSRPTPPDRVRGAELNPVPNHL